MMPLLAVVAVAVVMGAALLRRCALTFGWAAFLALSFLTGIGALSLLLLLLSVLGAGWSLPVAGVGIVIATAALFATGALLPSEQQGPPIQPLRWSRWGMVADLGSLAIVCGHAFFAGLAPAALHDYLAIWGLKAKVFWFAEGIDWAFLTSGWNAFSHPDYPLLLPLSYDAVAIFGGAWSDRWLGLFTTLFGLSLLLIVRRLLGEELPQPLPSIATLLIASDVMNPWIGMAEAPLVAYTGAGLFLLRRGSRGTSGMPWLLGALLLGLAAWTKNEGMSFMAATLLAVCLVARPPRLSFLLPAVCIPVPWIVLRSLHGMVSDIFSGNVVQRLVARTLHPGVFLLAIRSVHVGSPLFVAALAAGIALSLRRLSEEERLVILAVAFQFAICMVTYLATVYDVAWHVRWSWERVVTHMLVPIELVVAVALLSALGARRFQAA